jgi:hypothetical protein
MHCASSRQYAASFRLAIKDYIIGVLSRQQVLRAILLKAKNSIALSAKFMKE